MSRLRDGRMYDAYLNEPNGVWAHSENGMFKGVYIADTGNNCVRYADAETGYVRTLEFTGIPDRRETDKSNECKDCVFDLNEFQ